MFQAEGITKHYGSFTALAGVTLMVAAGEFVGIAGANGAGKTTLFDVLSGHTAGSGGRVTLDGRNLTKLPAYRRARLGLARTFQAPLVPLDMTVGEVFRAACVAYPPRGGVDAVATARALVRLAAPDDTHAGTLDTLDRRRLVIACLVIRRPRVLLLDEPCSGLLADEITELEDVVREIRAETGTAIVVVEHRLEFLRSMAERMVVLDSGRVIAEGSPSEVFSSPAVRAAYFATQTEVA